ncbi:MAG: sugar kinase [Bacteroidales bacterium]|nr:sugar kinase [Bacteroidales bacterium]
MKKIVTFGEIMLKLSPESFARLTQARSLKVEYSGAEANVAVSLSQLGMETVFVSKVPDNDMGRSAINFVRQFGVNTAYVCQGGERIGIYFTEKGAAQRASKVIYDRKHSAIATAEADDFDWEAIFRDAQWFHFTGITPALSENLAEICLQACKIAKANGIVVSCDLNYRSKLWSKEKAKATMSKLAPYVDVCIANEADMNDVFDFSSGKEQLNYSSIDEKSYQKVAKMAAEKLGFKKVAITLRESISASDNNWSAMLYDGTDFYQSKQYAIHIVDRIGSGDSFAAGLIYGFLQNFDNQKSLDFAVAASCLKHSIEGDYNLVTAAEVENLLNNNTFGRIQR